jgi:acylphosphatase
LPPYSPFNLELEKPMRLTKHLRLHGSVQGVFFRESMSQIATQLGVTGWVRNCGNGSLEIMLQGDKSGVAAAIEWAKRGPEFARVDKIEISDGSGEYTDFKRLPTR